MAIMNDYQNTAEYYDYLYKPNPLEVAFYRKFSSPFKRVLEMGCGTGRLTMDLALKSSWKTYECTDVSKPMLRVLQAKIDTISFIYPFYKKIQIKQIDMREYISDNYFDLIIYSFQSIQCLPKSQIKTQLQLSEKLLTKNGILIISTFDPKVGYIANSEHINSISVDKNQQLLTLIDTVTGFNDETFDYRQDLHLYNEHNYRIRTISENFSIGNIDYSFMKDLHKETNLKPIGFYSDYNQKPAQPKDKFFINVYKKVDL